MLWRFHARMDTLLNSPAKLLKALDEQFVVRLLGVCTASITIAVTVEGEAFAGMMFVVSDELVGKSINLGVGLVITAHEELIDDTVNRCLTQELRRKVEPTLLTNAKE